MTYQIEKTLIILDYIFGSNRSGNDSSNPHILYSLLTTHDLSPVTYNLLPITYNL